MMFSLMHGNSVASIILTTGERSEIGRYDFESWGSLPGFNRGMMRAIFQIFGMISVDNDRLNIFVMYSMPFGPRCLSIRVDIPSGPIALDALAFLIANWTSETGI
uniref:Uncharacterized protein n=1 Tax=Cacopsylla melanoneura TaxID=428564 RepID=A0A8D8QTQ4_9HEMI